MALRPLPWPGLGGELCSRVVARADPTCPTVCSLLLLGCSPHRDRKASCDRPWGGSRNIIPILPGVFLEGSRFWGPGIKAFSSGQFSGQERETGGLCLSL